MGVVRAVQPAGLVGDYEDLVTLDTGLRQLSDNLITGLESIVAQ